MTVKELIEENKRLLKIISQLIVEITLESSCSPRDDIEIQKSLIKKYGLKLKPINNLYN